MRGEGDPGPGSKKCTIVNENRGGGQLGGRNPRFAKNPEASGKHDAGIRGVRNPLGGEKSQNLRSPEKSLAP